MDPCERTAAEIAKHLDQMAESDDVHAAAATLMQEASDALKVKREDVRHALWHADLDELLPDWGRPTGTGGGLDRLTDAVLYVINLRRGFG